MRIPERGAAPGRCGLPVRCSALVALVVVASVAAAFACGPDFPESPLRQRSATLLSTPVGSFAFEASRLMERPTDGFPLVELDRTTTRNVEDAEPGGATILAMRSAPDEASAWAAGADLPEAVRLYTAGAVSFQRAFPRADSDVAPDGATPDAIPTAVHLAAARKHFGAVVALPAAESEARVVWAEFMLGRVAARETNDAEAAAHFQRTRTLVREGRPDPLGLAVASLGEEARLYLHHGTIAQATALYAQQAAYGSQGGIQSLAELANKILGSDRLLDEAFADPLARKLVFLYAFSYTIHERWEDDAGIDDPTDAAAASRSNEAPVSLIDRLVRVIESQQGEVENADEVARLAYEDARWDVAARMAAKSSTGLARWIDAKLALRRGDETAALRLYADAVKRLPVVQEPSFYERESPSQRALAEAELAVLHVTRAEFVAALERFYAATPRYWPEAAYVAERLLTADELKAFVDAHVPPPSPAELAAASEAYEPVPATRLRALLGRRLLRSDRFDEALAYFDDAELREYAREYGDALRGAAHDWSPVTRARDWYTAGKLARRHGLGLVGLELSPDWAMYEGDFDDGYFSVGLAGTLSGADDHDRVTPLERERFAATTPSPNVRFHYRYLAADYGERAADALARDSQAFAAVLCHTTAWIIGTDPARADALYARYLREGAWVPWGDAFGRRCPDPDFEGARWRRVKQSWARARRVTTNHPGFAAGAGLAVVCFLVAAVIVLRRRGTPVSPAP